MLEQVIVEDLFVRLTGAPMSPRQFKPVKAFLNALGGVWTSPMHAFVFPAYTDPAALIRDQLAAGEMPLHARNGEGYVRTPDELADWLAGQHVELALLPDGARVLEPSAGDGSLVRAILEANASVHVVAVEPNDMRARALDAIAAESGRVTVYRGTLEAYAEGHTNPFDAVIMNPPFALPDAPDAWMSHVRTAWQLLMPGAQLISVVPPSYQYRTGRPYLALRDQVNAAGGRYEELEDGSFSESGCDVRAGVLTFPRPLAARESGMPWWLSGMLPAGEPLRVREPRVTVEAITAAPVQVYADGGRELVMRFAGMCAICVRPLWTFDGGGHGALEWHEGSLDASAYGKSGPSVNLCLVCGNDGDKHVKAYEMGRPHWLDIVESVDIASAGPVYPLDIDAGMWVEMTGVDARDWDFTVVGQVMATPVHAEHNGRPVIAVKLRQRTGGDIELYADETSQVTVVDAPAQTGPTWATPARTASVPAAPAPIEPPAAAPAQPPLFDVWGPTIARLVNA